MYQVISDADAIDGCSKTRRFENVAGHDLNAAMPRAALQSRWISDYAPDAVSILQKPWHQTAADVAGGPGNENQKETSTGGAMT